MRLGKTWISGVLAVAGGIATLSNTLAQTPSESKGAIKIGYLMPFSGTF